ncbi:hypothetical protein [Streptomyces sp. NPDC002589]
MDFRHGLPSRARQALYHVAAGLSGPPLDPGGDRTRWSGSASASSGTSG